MVAWRFLPQPRTRIGLAEPRVIIFFFSCAQCKHADLPRCEGGSKSEEPPLDDPASPVYWIMSNRGRPKYKLAKAHPYASPYPPECPTETWDRIYSDADARVYMTHGKDATKARADRESGATWELARKMLDEKIAAGSLTTGSDVASPSPTTTANSHASAPFAFAATPSADLSMDGGNSILSIADKVKCGPRAAKRPLSAATSDQGSPAPQAAALGQAAGANAFIFNMPAGEDTPVESSPAPASEPTDTGKGERKRRGRRPKKGTAQSIKKKRERGKGMYEDRSFIYVLGDMLV
jgi:hypothetical protein